MHEIKRMGYIKSRQVQYAPEIEFTEIYIPNEANLGVGSFTTKIKAGALLREKFISSIIANPPFFQLSVNLNSVTLEVPILIGRANEDGPISRKVFQLPIQMDRSATHNLVVNFDNWEISTFKMDGKELLEVSSSRDLKETKNQSKKAFNISRIEFLENLIDLLEKLFPCDFFINEANKTHLVYKRWEFCKKIITQGGIIKFPEQEQELPLLVRILIDSSIFITNTEGNLRKFKIGNFEKFTKKVKIKILNSISDSLKFDDIMLELSVAAWHLIEGNKAEILEINNYPDVKVHIPKIKLPFYFECKNLNSDNIKYLEKNIEEKIKKADEQLKSVKEPNYGLVVFNITKPLSLKQVKSDVNPTKVNEAIALIQNFLSESKFIYVRAVLLIWDDYIKINQQDKIHVAYRRRVKRIDHVPNAKSLTVPPDIDLFNGYTSEVNFSSS